MVFTKNENMKISYAITVCNEHEEINRLLQLLTAIIDSNDEIIIQGDSQKITREVWDVIDGFESDKRIRYCTAVLNANFAAFKNHLISHCTGDYIFNIDADEYPNSKLVENLKPILSANEDVDCFAIPRVNTLLGEGVIEYAKSIGWVIRDLNGVQTINWPDCQFRLFKNNGLIRFINPVHEILTGYTQLAYLPWEDGDFSWALFHPKDIDRQKRQNRFYQTI